MLCEICGENEATFHYSEVVNGNKTEHHLCAECASRTDISYYSSFFDNDRVGQFLSGLLGNVPILGNADDNKLQIMCPTCKTSYGEFIKNSAFGCADCYGVFEPLLGDSIKKLQGSTMHQGKKPKRFTHEMNVDKKTVSEAQGEEKNGPENIQEMINTLSERLKISIEEEDFSQAAILRDRIRELKHSLESDKRGEKIDKMV